MHYNFYFDETFHDRKITIKENGTINTLLEDKDGSYIGVFLGFDNRYKSNFFKKFTNLEKKYKVIFDISNEFKSTTFKRKNFIYGVSSFNDKTYEFYNELFDLLCDNRIIYHVNVLSKVELLVRKLYPVNLLREFSFIVYENSFYYSLTKFIITYNNKELIKKLYQSIDENNKLKITNELIKHLDITIDTIQNIERKKREVPALRNLSAILSSIKDNNVIESKIDFIYEQNFIGLKRLMEERKSNISKIDLVIDKEQKTYQTALEFGFNTVEEKDSKSTIFLRIVDHICGFIGKMMYSITNNKEFKEDNVESIDLLKNNDIVRKHLLSKEWFILNEKQFLLYKKIGKALVTNHKFYWTSMAWAYSDEIVMFYSFINYINSYYKYNEYMAVLFEKHSEYFNNYVCSTLEEQYKKMYR